MPSLKQILVAIWILIISILTGFAVLGLYKKELLGYIAFSIFPAAILANLSIVIAYNVKNGSQHIAKAVWLFLSIAVVVFALVVGDPQHPKTFEETEIIIGYSMCTLSFPSCFPIVYLYFGLAHLSEYLGSSSPFGSEKMSFYLANFISWSGFFIVGYLQWFKLLPHLLEKWRSKRSDASPS